MTDSAGKPPCSLCGKPWGAPDPWVLLEQCLEHDHPLFRYCGTAMHWECFVAWPQLAQFETASAAFMSVPERRLKQLRLLEEREQTFLREIARHNETHSRVMAALRERGTLCPHCGARSRDYRELPGDSRVRARLVCNACARSCEAEELVLA